MKPHLTTADLHEVLGMVGTWDIVGPRRRSGGWLTRILDTMDRRARQATEGLHNLFGFRCSHKGMPRTEENIYPMTLAGEWAYYVETEIRERHLVHAPPRSQCTWARTEAPRIKTRPQASPAAPRGPPARRITPAATRHLLGSRRPSWWRQLERGSHPWTTASSAPVGIAQDRIPHAGTKMLRVVRRAAS